MTNYKVEMIQSETFIVSIEADSEQEAADKAQVEFDNGNYKEMGDCSISIGGIHEE